MTNNGKLKTATHQTNEISAKPITTSLKCKWRTSRLLMLFFMVCLLDIPLMALNDMPLLAELMGEHTMSSFGYSIISLDFNHDGYDDLIVLSLSYGYQYPGITTPSKGKVYIYYGGPGFSSTAEPAMSLEGDYPNGTMRRITYIADIGDVNGDGFDDLMIRDTIPNASGSTRFMFYYGGTADLSTPDRIEDLGTGEDLFWIAKLGDVDGDGYSDIGFFSQSTIVSKFEILWGGDFCRQIVISGSDIANYPNAITGIGDINNDGYDDFAVGFAIGSDNISSYTINLYHGNQDRLYGNPSMLVTSAIQITCIGKPLGDLNSDGYADFLGYVDYNGLKLWMGSDVIEYNTADVILNPLYFGNLFVEGIESGDFNGDGYSDVVGASYNNQRFAIWLGSYDMDGNADLIKGSTMEYFGYDIAVGDFNGDGYDDVAISAPYNDLGPAWEHPGYVYIYAGGIGMVDNEDLLAPEIEASWHINVYPNPFTLGDNVHIDFSGDGYKQQQGVTVNIYNLKGQKVAGFDDINPANTYQIPAGIMSKMGTGIYLLSVQQGDKSVYTKKICVF